jgi:hypothetical protein
VASFGLRLKNFFLKEIIMKPTVIGAVLGLLLLIVSTQASRADALLGINPSSQTLGIGSTLELAIDISGLGSGAGLSAYVLNIGFDPLRLAYQKTIFGDPMLGDQLDLSHSGMNGPLATPAASNVNLVEFSLDDTATLLTQQASSFTLATLYFSLLSVGSSEITLAVNSLSGVDSNPISFNTQNVTVTGSSPIPIPLPGGFLIFISGYAMLRLTIRRQKH